MLSQKSSEKPGGIRNDKVDYLVKTGSGAQFPFELKTIKTMKAAEAFVLAKSELFKNKPKSGC